jgi:hypothetical protein
LNCNWKLELELELKLKTKNYNFSLTVQSCSGVVQMCWLGILSDEKD